MFLYGSYYINDIGFTVHSYDCIFLICRSVRDSSDKTNGTVSTFIIDVLILTALCLLYCKLFQVLWPLSWFLSGSGEPLLLGIYPGFILVICGAALRHLLRTILPLVFSASTLP